MKKITDLLKDIAEYPYTGIGKPEPLKYELAGYWSRRINSEHRIIYSVHDDIVTNILNFYEISLKQVKKRNTKRSKKNASNININ